MEGIDGGRNCAERHVDPAIGQLWRVGSGTRGGALRRLPERAAIRGAQGHDAGRRGLEDHTLVNGRHLLLEGAPRDRCGPQLLAVTGAHRPQGTVRVDVEHAIGEGGQPVGEDTTGWRGRRVAPAHRASRGRGSF